MTKAWYIETDTIFEIIGPENIGIDTKIKFQPPIVRYIRHFENLYGGYFEKWPVQIESALGPTLKRVIGAYS